MAEAERTRWRRENRSPFSPDGLGANLEISAATVICTIDMGGLLLLGLEVRSRLLQR
jgi:hypothetical protein